jgi:hypothetical protein
MKLGKLYLFLILVAVILTTTLGFNITEGLENRHSKRENIRRRSEIQKKDEDLYILKSSIVPPVCPKCPQSSVCPRQKPCPACRPCGRCPEPAFKCKKVPNYQSMNTQYLPVPTA